MSLNVVVTERICFQKEGKREKELCVQKVTRLRASPGPCYVGALTES